MTPVRERRVITDRVLLLALDQLYRERMRRHEVDELLDCASTVAAAIGVEPTEVPIEGYYTESPQLSRYFLLMRALQAAPRGQRSRVADLPQFQRLQQVVTSPIFGVPTDDLHLLPKGRDPLCWALEGLRPSQCSVPVITKRACEEAVSRDDCSLVGLAALIEDSVVLAALRESVVLYAAIGYLGLDSLGEPEYVWEVTPLVAERAEGFIRKFCELFDDCLPAPHPDNAEVYWDAYDEEEILGRCVRIAVDDSCQPPRHYHWGIRWGPGTDLVVDDFWCDEIWTAERYRRERGGALW